jgi:hypothetical protein
MIVVSVIVITVIVIIYIYIYIYIYTYMHSVGCALVVMEAGFLFGLGANPLSSPAVP